MKDFLLCGVGELTYSDNAVHRGEFAHDEPHGPGTLTFPDGAVLSGNFKLGKINGSMVFRTPGSTRFLDCIDGEAAGTPGTIKLDDGGHYEGDMTPFKPHGKGVHTHPGGQVYRGEFERGLPHGVGEVTFPNGRAVLTGTWRDGRAHGMMTMTTDAYISKVEFVMGFAAHTGTVQDTDGRTYQGRMHMFLPQVADGGSTQHDPAFKTLGLQPALGRPFGIGAPPTTAPQSAPNAFGPKPASGAPGTPQAAPNAFGPKPASGAPFAFGVAPPSASSVPLTSSPHATTVCPDSCSRLEDKGNIAL